MLIAQGTQRNIEDLLNLNNLKGGIYEQLHTTGFPVADKTNNMAGLIISISKKEKFIIQEENLL